MTIQSASVKQEGSELLGTKDKTLYYLLIKNKQGKQLIINVGEKTHKEVTALKEEEDRITEIKSEQDDKRGK